MTRFDYAGRGGLDWPVAPGDLWRVGPHMVLCGDIELGSLDLVAEWMEADPPALVYVDPPWGAGVHRAFRTKAGLAPALDYDSLMLRVLSACTLAPVALVEMGNRERDHVVRLAKDCGLSLRREWQITYLQSGRPCALLGFTHPAPPLFEGWVESWPDFEGMDDARTPGLAVEALTEPGQLVADFCVGLGHTADAAASAGRVFVGSELHSKRVSATLSRLSKVTGERPDLFAHFPAVAHTEED